MLMGKGDLHSIRSASPECESCGDELRKDTLFADQNEPTMRDETRARGVGKNPQRTDGLALSRGPKRAPNPSPFVFISVGFAHEFRNLFSVRNNVVDSPEMMEIVRDVLEKFLKNCVSPRRAIRSPFS